VTFAFFLLYLVVSYINPADIFPVLAPYRVAFSLGLIGLFFAVGSCVRRSGAPFRNVQIWMLIGLTLTMSLSRMLADHWLGAPVAVIGRFGSSLTMFVVTICAIDSLRKIRITAICIVLLSMVLLLQGAAAYHFGYHANMFLFDPEKRTEYLASADADDPDYDPDSDEGSAVRIRGLGFLHDPNDLALGFVLAMPLLGCLWKSRAVLRNFLLVLAPLSLFVYGVFLTHSRGGSVAILFTALLFAWRFGKMRSIALVLVLTAGIVAMNFSGGRSISTADDSAEGRIASWSEGLQMLKAQPLLGVGYALFLEHHTLTAHNSFVLCFAETGIIGYFFWLGMIVTLFFQLQGLSRMQRERPEQNAREIGKWASILKLSMVAFLTGAFFLSRTFIPLLYLVMALATALVLIAQEEGYAVELPSFPRMSTIILAYELASILFIYILVRFNALALV
jgi:O-Antigen ligase